MTALKPLNKRFFGIIVIMFIAFTVIFNVWYYLNDTPVNTIKYNDTEREVKQIRQYDDSKTNIVNDDFDAKLMDIWNNIYKTNGKILHGIKQHLYTIVSGYIFIKKTGKIRKDKEHSYLKFVTNTAKMYRLHEPMIMFEGLDNKSIIDYYFDIRISVNISTILIPITVNDLLFSKLLENRKNRVSVHCLVWMNKFAFMRFVSIINPFQSKYFLWLDAGFFKWSNPIKIINSNKTRLINKLKQLDDNKVLFADAEIGKLGKLCKKYLIRNNKTQCLSSEYRAYSIDEIMGNWDLGEINLVGGGDFISTKIGIKTFSDIYFKEFQYTQSRKIQRYCSDQGLFATISCIYPDIANFIWCNKTDYGGGVYQVMRWLTDEPRCYRKHQVNIYNLG